MIVAVLHEVYRRTSLQRMRAKLLLGACVIDVKAVLDQESYEAEGYHFWRL